MTENVVYLHGPPAIGHYLRVGASGHRQLELLHGAGRLTINRVVIEASMVARQKDLIAALSDSGAELILDTNVAELSSIGRFEGAVKAAPWANPIAVLSPDDLSPTANRDVIGQIARFAIEHRFHAVLAPTHFVQNSTDPLLAIDLCAAEALRKALDRHGGQAIGIDYSLTIPNAALRDPVQRRAFVAGLDNIPYDNLWLRISGFGADATPTGLRRYIATVFDFHKLGRPVIADGVGGLAGLAAVAFGAAGGLCHGVAEKERFDASSWTKPPTGGGGGGREKRVLVEGLDRLLSVKQMDLLMAAPGARRHFSCNDPNCCPRGLDDTRKNPKGHYLQQRQQQVETLSRVPELRRAQHYLEQQLAPVRQSAQKAAALELGDEGLKRMLIANQERLERTENLLGVLRGALPQDERSAPPVRRAGAAGASSKGRSRP